MTGRQKLNICHEKPPERVRMGVLGFSVRRIPRKLRSLSRSPSFFHLPESLLELWRTYCCVTIANQSETIIYMMSPDLLASLGQPHPPPKKNKKKTFFASEFGKLFSLIGRPFQGSKVCSESFPLGIQAYPMCRMF